MPSQLGREGDAMAIAGGTNLLDLMKLQVETPRNAGRHQPPDDGPRSSDTDDGGLRIGALATNTATRGRIRGCAATIRCWPARSWPARRSNCATRRRPAAICASARAAIISPISTSPATSANRARGCGAINGIARICTPYSAPATSASPPIPATWPWRWPRWTPGRDRRRRAARRDRAGARFPPPARATRRRRTTCWSRARSSPASPCRRPRRRQADISQGARTVVLRLCAGLGRGRGRDGRMADHPRRPGLRRAGAQAVARSAHRRAAGRANARRPRCSTRPPTCCWKMRRAMARTISRYRWRAARCGRACAKRPEVRA